MTPKQKAQELVYKYYELVDDIYSNEAAKKNAKMYALIAVEEILKDDWYIATREDLIARKEYWNEVKQEINKL